MVTIDRKYSTRATIVESIRVNLREKSTEELLEIWKKNNREEWSDEAFEAIKELLVERGDKPPSQDYYTQNGSRPIKEKTEMKIKLIQGSSRFRQCTNCKATLPKKENLMRTIVRVSTVVSVYYIVMAASSWVSNVFMWEHPLGPVIDGPVPTYTFFLYLFGMLSVLVSPFALIFLILSSILSFMIQTTVRRKAALFGINVIGAILSWNISLLLFALERNGGRIVDWTEIPYLIRLFLNNM